MSTHQTHSERHRLHKIKISFIMEVVHLVVLARKDTQSAEARQEELIGRLNGLLEGTAGSWSSVLFDGESVFVDGQMLCVEEALYHRAQRIMQALARLNVYEIQFHAPLTSYDVQRLLAYLLRQQPLTSMEQTLTPRLRVRAKSASLLTGWEMTLEPGELCARTCATALVVMRNFYDRALQGDMSTLPHVKRVAQNMVVLTERYPSMLLAILGALPEQQDVPTIVTKSAVLAIMMMRRLTRDRRNIIDVAMSALLYDLGTLQLMRERNPVISYRDTEQFDAWSHAPPEELAPRLPVAAASMVTRLGEVGEASLARSIYVYESLEMAHGMGGYRADQLATIEASLLTVARRFIKKLSPASGHSLEPATVSRVDRAIAQIEEAATRRTDRLLVGVMLDGLGLVARGEKVVLSSGYRGVVVANHERPSCFARPVVRVVRKPDGTPERPSRDIDLSLPTQESAAFGGIASLMREPDDLLEQARERILRPAMKAPKPRLLDALGKKKKRFERAPKPVINVSTQAPLDEDSEEVFEDAVTQIRKAPQVLAQIQLDVESLLEQTQDDVVALSLHSEDEEDADVTQEDVFSIQARSVGPLSWDEGDDTSASAPSDRIQMLNAADIAHMVPEELLDAGEGIVNQDFSVAPFMRKGGESPATDYAMGASNSLTHESSPPSRSGVPHDAQVIEDDVTIERIGSRDALHASIVSLESFAPRASSGPEDAIELDEIVSMAMPSVMSMSPETWNNLHDDLDEESSITGPSSDRLVVLGGLSEGLDEDDELGPQDTALLPPNVVDALMTRDRRRHVFGHSMVEDEPDSSEEEKSGK